MNLARIRTWLTTHKRAAIAGAGAAGVAGYALYRSNASSGSAPDATTGGTPAVAGISAPATGSGVVKVTGLGDLEKLLRRRLPPVHPKKPKPPKPPNRLPGPGQSQYTIVHGDTLKKIALKVYGDNKPADVRPLRVHNPVLATFPGDANLNFFAGHVMVIPRHPQHKHNPKPPHHKPPKHHPKPPKKHHRPVWPVRRKHPRWFP